MTDWKDETHRYQPGGDRYQPIRSTTRLRRVLRARVALAKLDEIESELREQASGSQDGYLLDVANRMREALKQFN